MCFCLTFIKNNLQRQHMRYIQNIPNQDVLPEV